MELEAIIFRTAASLTTCKFRLNGEVMQVKLQEQLSPADIECPIEAVLEMAIATFVDIEALGFADCKPGRGQ